MNSRSSKILRLSWILKKGYEKSLEEVLVKHNLTRHEANVLLFLGNNEINTAHAISRYTSISKSLVSLAINSLNERNLLVIKCDKDDKRINKLYLTELANTALEDLNLAQDAFYMVLENNISNDELKMMDEVLKKLYKNVHKQVVNNP